MAANYISAQAHRYYTALSTDIVDNKITGASYVGIPVYITDTKTWYIINPDQTLSPYIYPPITNAGNITTSSILQNAVSANANGTAMNVSQYSTVGFDVEVSGTPNFTVNFEVSNDNTHWYPVNTTQSGTTTILNTTSSVGIYYANVTTITYARAKISGYSGTGTITVTAYADPAVRTEKVINASIVGSLPYETLTETKTQVDAVAGVVTFSANIYCLEILNTDATNDGVFTVNGLIITVPKKATNTPGTIFKAVIGGTPGTTVAISGATTYVLNRYV